MWATTGYLVCENKSIDSYFDRIDVYFYNNNYIIVSLPVYKCAHNIILQNVTAFCPIFFLERMCIFKGYFIIMQLVLKHDIFSEYILSLLKNIYYILRNKYIWLVVRL